MPPSPPTLLLARKGHDFPGTPGFSPFSMEMKPSPAASTTHLRPIDAAAAEEEQDSRTPSRESFAKHQHRASADQWQPLRIVQWSRVVFSLLLVAAGAAVVGCEAHALHSYSMTHLGEDWFLPLWPQDLDLRPSVGLLVGGGAVVVLMGCLSLGCAIVQRVSPPGRSSFLLNVLFIAISVLGLVAAAFATGFSAKIYANNNSSPTGSRDTIQSWSCRWYDGAKNAHNNSSVQIASTAHTNGTSQGATSGHISSPSGFGRVCLESHAAFDVAVLVVVMEVGAVGLSCAAWWLERRMR